MHRGVAVPGWSAVILPVTPRFFSRQGPFSGQSGARKSRADGSVGSLGGRCGAPIMSPMATAALPASITPTASPAVMAVEVPPMLIEVLAALIVVMMAVASFSAGYLAA